MRTVALVGFALPTRPYVKETKADEIWTLNSGWQFTSEGIAWLRANYPGVEIRTEPDIPRIDRLFELHRPEYLRDPNYPDVYQWPWLVGAERGYPVYMIEAYPEVPGAVEWDYEAITERVFGKVRRGGKRNVYYTSGFCFLCAQAIVEGWDRIEIYGFEMHFATEYADQRPAAYYFIGHAAALGIEVVLHPESDLMKSKVYGYESAGLVQKQLIEQKLRLREDEYEKMKAVTNGLYAQLQLAGQNGRGDQEVQELFAAFDEAKDRMHLYLGAKRELEQLISEANLNIPDYSLGEPLMAVNAKEMEHNGEQDQVG